MKRKVKSFRNTQAFTKQQLNTILHFVECRKDREEMSLLVYLLLHTRLKVGEVLGWFNRDVDQRIEFLETLNIPLSDFMRVPILFTKTHQAYLNRWKKTCKTSFGVENATFEMLKRKKVVVQKAEEGEESEETVSDDAFELQL